MSLFCWQNNVFDAHTERTGFQRWAGASPSLHYSPEMLLGVCFQGLAKGRRGAIQGKIREMVEVGQALRDVFDRVGCFLWCIHGKRATAWNSYSTYIHQPWMYKLDSKAPCVRYVPR